MLMTTSAGGANPSRCQSRHPSTTQAKMPAASEASFSGSPAPVLLLGRDMHREREQLDPSPDGLVGAGDARAVIGGQPDRVARGELEEVVIEEPGRQRVPACKLLHQLFG